MPQVGNMNILEHSVWARGHKPVQDPRFSDEDVPHVEIH